MNLLQILVGSGKNSDDMFVNAVNPYCKHHTFSLAPGIRYSISFWYIHRDPVKSTDQDVLVLNIILSWLEVLLDVCLVLNMIYYDLDDQKSS